MAKKSFKKDPDYYCEQVSPPHISKILWSRDGNDYYADGVLIPETGGSFSETERTLSSCSWGFDDYEIKSTKRIDASLDAIENALYDDSYESSLSDEVIDECQRWSDKFPHLRLTGKEIVPITVDSNVSQSSGISVNLRLPTGDNLSTINHFQDDFQTCQVEEIFAKDGIYEDEIEKQNEHQSCKLPFEKDSSPSFSVDYMADKVIEKLAGRTWAQVLLKWGKPKESISSFELNDCLPPISNSFDSSGKSTHERPWSRRKMPKTSDFPKLDGILTVSPKVLQQKVDTRTTSANHQTRPNTGISLKSYSSVNSFNLVRPESKKSPEKDSEIINAYLPILEENSPLLQRRLIGDFNTLSKCKFLEPNNFPVRPTFLPPIDDRDQNMNCTNMDLQRPISYESHLPGYKKHSIYTRHLNKLTSRPSTTKTTWDMRNPNIDGKKLKDVSSTKSKNLLSVNNRKKPNIDNLINLFPIVTQLEPKQPNKSKNQSFSSKNSSLGAFQQKSQR